MTVHVSPRSRMAAVVTALTFLVLGSPVLASTVSLEVLSVDPSFSPYNIASRTVTIKGIGFTASTTVKFDAVVATPTFVDSRTLTAIVPTVASPRVSTITISDPANGTDTFFPYLYTGPVIHVATTGDDKDSGVSPTAPKRTITAALAACSGTTPTEVRVAAGRYAEAQLAILNATALSCGWVPGFATRDPERNITDIDANRGGYVLRTYGITSSQVIDGCTFRNGLRDGFGGGAIAITADSPVVNNNVIVGNMSTTQGGGVYFIASTSYGGRPTLSNNVILGNRAHGKSGGGIVVYPNYNTQQAVRVNVTGNQIVGNRSVNSRGGGVSFVTGSYSGYNNASLKVVNNLVGYNKARTGGGIDISTLTYGDTIDITYENNLVVGNRVQGVGGGVSFQGLGTIFGRVVSNTVAMNSAGPSQGGGFVVSGSINLVSTFTASDLILWGNSEGDVLGQAIDRVVFSDAGMALPGVGNISADPAFATGPRGIFYLRQEDPNLPDSPAVDMGSGSAVSLSLDSLTTRSDLLPDTGLADLGYHYSPVGEDSPEPISFTRVDPSSGDLYGNDWILIRGDGFDLGATVTVGGNPATNVIYLSPTRLMAQPAPHSLGLVDIRIDNPDTTYVEAANAYRYVDNEAPVWVSTVGVISVETSVDCVRSAVVDWNDAVDAVSPPVVYEVYRVDCEATTSNQVPCANFGFIPSAISFKASTVETFYVDPNFASGGGDPRVIYAVRARDSASPATNKDWNFAKRVSYVRSLGTDTVPPSPVGNTLLFKSPTNMDWTGAKGAVSYAVYRTTSASLYQNPGSLTPLITLTVANNDFNGDGVTDSSFVDYINPPVRSCFFYRIAGVDLCNIQTTSELLP